MAITPAGYLSQEKLAAEIERITPLLGPDVVRLRYSTGLDWSDEPSISFRIVLADHAIGGDASGRVEQILFDEIRPHELGMRLYTRFRSQSEQAQLDGIDLDWA